MLDIELNDDLIAEGKLRELIRELQVARKEADFNIDDRIVLNVNANGPEIGDIIENNLKTINAEVLAVSNEPLTDNCFTKEIDIDGKLVVVKMKKA